MNTQPVSPKRTTLVIRSQFAAFHCWPEAPEDVGFLRSTHRHLFHVELEIDGSAGDRYFEFFQVKQRLDITLFIWDGKDLGEMSCEKIAEDIGRKMIGRGYPVVSCAVFEDGENGARVYW